MSDLGEMFGALHAMQQEKRANNRRNSAELLQIEGIPFVEKNDGAHLIIREGRYIYDFWPGTGLWHRRVNGPDKRYKDRGVFKLIRDVKRIRLLAAVSATTQPEEPQQ